VIVVGGGIAGLAAAFALQEHARRLDCALTLTVIEADRDWGGKIQTHRVGDCLLETGPDSFLSQKPWGLELCAKLGLAEHIIGTNEQHKATYVYSRGRLRQLPEGLVMIVPRKLGPFLRSGLLSWPGLIRMGLDLLLPAMRHSGDESVAAFFTRRMGREACERLVEPLMAGIYGGNAAEMSLRATFPRFLDLEERYGSVIRGLMKGARRPTEGRPRTEMRSHSMFVTLREGLSGMVGRLLEAIQAAGGTLLVGQQVTAVHARRHEPGREYLVELAGGRTLTADALILATPAFVTAGLVHAVNPAAAECLRQIPYASTMTVSLLYPTAAVSGILTGYGFVVPRVENSALLAATNSSLKWPERTPPEKFAVRCYLGGVGREAVFSHDDREIVRRVKAELRRMTGLDAKPIHAEVNRWEHAMPQYTVGHLDRLKSLQEALSASPGFYVTGAAYRGVGIPDCIHDGTETADALLRDWLGDWPSFSSSKKGTVPL
jgi:oxygen-dependent protoporphyrinogen oxidase